MSTDTARLRANSTPPASRAAEERHEGQARARLAEQLPAPASSSQPRKRRFLAPEVIQSSAMDCGPAVLKALLGGFHLPVHYGRLREACKTSVDGTSIDTLEELARAFGLEAVQTVVPVDHVLVPEARALPAIAVVDRPRLGNHFVLLWNRIGPYVQVMDPAAGRRWVRWETIAPTLLRYTTAITTSAWLAWASSPLFLRPLEARLSALGVSSGEAEALLELARSQGGWSSLGALDAATRFCASLRQAGVKVDSAAETIRALVEAVHASFEQRFELLPRHCWSVDAQAPDAGSVTLTGVLVVSARARTGVVPQEQTLGRELQLALEEDEEHPERELARFLAGERRMKLAMLSVGALVAPVGLLCQSVLLRRVLDLAADLGLGLQRLGASVLLAGFVAVLVVLELLVHGGVLRLGRVLETRLRMAFLQKIPRLHDLYLQSRLSSDMAERSHMMHMVRTMPSLLFTGTRALVGMLATVVAIGLVDPRLWGWASLLGVLCVGLPLAFRRRMTEQDLRARTQLGGLSRTYLDSLLGAVPLRAHGAEEALGREHEVLLTGWMRSSLQLLRSMVTMRTAQAVVGAGLSITLLTLHLDNRGLTGGVLLIAWWIMSLPEYAQQLATALQQYPASRNIALRCFEPLGAPEVEPRPAVLRALPSSTAAAEGAQLSMRDVSVDVSGHGILHGINLDIRPGTHVAIVGRSGAGKSTLLGLLLGWYRPSGGTLQVDGEDFEHLNIEALRRQTAWVDPTVRLWNQTIASNLTYGQDGVRSADLSQALAASELDSVLERLPEGLQTSAGEGGIRLSGGEGQRLRFARALLRKGVRLALLDEPFRGLDRGARRRLLERARRHWKGATLLCVTHDVSETRGFDEVLVIEEGRLLERGTPEELLAKSGSRYRALLLGDELAQRSLREGEGWRRWRVESGRVIE